MSILYAQRTLPNSFLSLSLLLFIVTQSLAQPKKEFKIIYVGNSLTYVNDLPLLIKEIGDKDGKTITYTSFLFPDYSMEDHWNEGKVQEEIEKGGYDFAVMQQGPSAAPESQGLLLEYSRRFEQVCTKMGTKLALYMVWPAKTRSFDHENVIRSYTNAAAKTSSLLCPAGLAWKYAWQADANLQLYSADNFHPTIAGSLLAAFSIYASLFKKSDFMFIQADNFSWKNNISSNELLIIKQAALKANISQ